MHEILFQIFQAKESVFNILYQSSRPAVLQSHSLPLFDHLNATFHLWVRLFKAQYKFWVNS